jgi:hypothetical protein
MQITLEYMGFITIEDVPSGSTIEVPEGTTIEQLLDRLGMEKQHRTYLRPLVDQGRKPFDYQLQEGDGLFLYFPVGGG